MPGGRPPGSRNRASAEWPGPKSGAVEWHAAREQAPKLRNWARFEFALSQPPQPSSGGSRDGNRGQRREGARAVTPPASPRRADDSGRGCSNEHVSSSEIMGIGSTRDADSSSVDHRRTNFRRNVLFLYIYM